MISSWLRELALGARMARAGARGAWTRTAMTAVGVGLGVALLLFAAAVPAMVSSRDERVAARDDLQLSGGPPRDRARTVVVAYADSEFHDHLIRGRLLQPLGAQPPTPPGVERLPGPGQAVVSPQLAQLLASDDGALLRQRLPYRVVGTIGDAGLEGPGEYAYYAGSDRLVGGAPASGETRRIDHFGSADPSPGLTPIISVLAVIVFTALLMPVAIFIATAVRFGGEARNRRLAAVRLVVAAGEALLGALLGLVAGALIFLLARQLVSHLTLWRLSAFPADIHPGLALAVLIAVAVPVLSVVVTLVALRGVAIEPLGVTRQTQPRRRRLWWRLLPSLAGLLALYPLLGQSDLRSGHTDVAVAAGVVLLLAGVATLLPWLVEAIVWRVGVGGGVAWQLAARRLQHDSGTAARVVCGIAVAAAGAIALQTLFSGVDQTYTRESVTSAPRVQALASFSLASDGPRPDEIAARLRAAPGVSAVVAERTTGVAPAGRNPQAVMSTLTVGDCAALRERARVGRCADGDVFLVRDRAAAAAGSRSGASSLRPGETVVAGERGSRWRLPAGTRRAPSRAGPAGDRFFGVLATPAAVAGIPLSLFQLTAYLTLDPAQPDAIEQARNVAAAVDPRVRMSDATTTTTDSQFANLRRGLFAGAVAVLTLIGASMLVSALEQLRERRRLIAALVAFGTPRATLARSLLWQAALPVALGLALAIVTGSALGALLLRIVGEPVSLDAAAILGMTAAGAAVVLLVTALTLPALRRLTRPEGLRTE
jgi:hypothetical protein